MIDYEIVLSRSTKCYIMVMISNNTSHDVTYDSLRSLLWRPKCTLIESTRAYVNHVLNRFRTSHVPATPRTKT